MESYFLAGRSAHWTVVGCSLFSYGTGVEYIIGMTVSGFKDGMSASFFMWGSIPPLIALGYYFLKEYRATDIITLPTYLFKPYNGKTRAIYASFVLLLSFRRIALSLSYSAQLVEDLVGIEPAYTSLFAALCAVCLVCFGGLKGIMHIEVVQTLVLLAFSFVFMGEVFERKSLSEILDETPDNRTRLLHGASDAVAPWPGIVFGFPVEAMVYWCCSQVITQKALAGRDDYNAKAGCLFCGVLNFLPPFLFVLPGMAARVLYEEELIAHPNLTFAYLFKEILPPSCAGFLLAGLLCSLLTSVASVLCSASAIITLDVFECTPYLSYVDQSIFSVFEKGVVVQKGSIFVVAAIGYAASFAVPYSEMDQWSFIMTSAIYSSAILAAFLSASIFMWHVKPAVISVVLVAGLVLGLLRNVLQEVHTDGHHIPSWLRWYGTCHLYELTAVLFALYMFAIYVATRVLEMQAAEKVSSEPHESERAPTEACSVLSAKTAKLTNYSGRSYNDDDDDYEDETVVWEAVTRQQKEQGEGRMVDVVAGVELLFFIVIVTVWCLV